MAFVLKPRPGWRRLSTRALQTFSSNNDSTVNPSEIAHFSRLSSLWWDEQGEFKFLHTMNPVRVQFMREKLLETTHEEQRDKDCLDLMDGLDVLDVGCGGGLLSESLARIGARTLGIDASESNVRIASLHASADPKLSSLNYRHSSAETLLEEPKRFDVVCSMEVIEHVDNPAQFLSTCAELVKPGGHLFLSTIARTPLSYLLTILLAEHILRKVSLDTHTYSKFVNPSELIAFFRKYRPSPPTTRVQPSTYTPWISRVHQHGIPIRTEAEVRGMVYVPWKGQWVLMPRSLTEWGAAECNYLFWVRRPAE